MYNTARSLDGLKLCFDDLKKNTGYEENLLKFSVCIGNSKSALPRFRVVFDTMNGTISYYSGDNPYGELVTVASDNILKYKNLKDNPFSIVFKVLSVGDISVNFTLADKTVTGIIPKAFYDRYITDENVYFGISTSNKNGYFSLVLSDIEKVTALSFEKDWYKNETIFTPQNMRFRMPEPEKKAGHHFFAWQDSAGNLYNAGETVTPATDSVFTASVAYPGDTDLNGIKNSDDLVTLRKYLLGVQKVINDTADVNCNSKIDIIDLIRLKKIISS